MTELLVRHFVKNYEDIEKASVRSSYGVLASMVGVFCNIVLFVIKWLTGFFLHSVSVMADAFNNLSDAGSCIVSLVGVKIASKPADEEHPFGHGRMEYIAALIVSFLVLEVGFTFFKEAIGKIRNPEEMKFQVLSVVLLCVTIVVKLWMGYFNRTLGKKIDSKVMMAAATDSMGDVVTTSATILSVLVWRFTGINVDGFVGIGVALVVMWAGVGIAKDTLEPLLGEAVPQEEYDKITRFVEKYEGIVGSHDLIVHNYGPTKNMASIHAEVPNDVDVETSHEVIDRIERDAHEQLGIYLVIHMDPIETKDKEVLAVKKKVEDILEALDPAVSIHDFRMVSGTDQINLIFDLVVPFEYDNERQYSLTHSLMKLIQIMDKRYQCVITLERSYIASDKK